MARLLVASLASGLAVPAAALRMSSGPLAPECRCLRWKEVYERYNVTCGEGLERFALESDDNGFDFPAYSGPLLASSSPDDLLRSLNETGRLVQVCTQFYERMNHTFAMNVHANFLDRGLESHRVWCYVEDHETCDKSVSEFVPNSQGIRVKLFNEWEVASLRKQRMVDFLLLAKYNVLDLAMLLPVGGYTNLQSDRFAIDNISDATLQVYKRMRKPVMLPAKGRKTAKLFVYGNEVITFLPGWPHGSVPFKEDFHPTPPPDCLDEDCLEFDDYNEFCVRCDDDQIYEDPKFGDFSDLMFHKPPR